MRAARGSAPLRALVRRYEGPGSGQEMDTSKCSLTLKTAAMGSPVNSGASQSARATMSTERIRRRVLDTVSPPCAG